MRLNLAVRGLMTIRQAAISSGKSTSTIREAIARGALGTVTLSGYKYPLIHRSALHRWLTPKHELLPPGRLSLAAKELIHRLLDEADAEASTGLPAEANIDHITQPQLETASDCD